MNEATGLRKQLLLLEQDLIRLHERLIPLLDTIIEVIGELDSRVKVLEDDMVKKTIAFEAKKAGVSEEQFLAMIADYIRAKIEGDKL